MSEIERSHETVISYMPHKQKRDFVLVQIEKQHDINGTWSSLMLVRTQVATRNTPNSHGLMVKMQLLRFSVFKLRNRDRDQDIINLYCTKKA